MTDDQKCALIQGLHPHCHHIENFITKGDKDDKRIITEVLKNLFKHNNCDNCDLDFARDILVKSGKSVQEVVQLDPESTKINDRLTWIAEHVYDKDTICKIGSKLGLPLDRVKELITSNRDILVASTIEVLRLWDESCSSSMTSARQRKKLLEALRVIKKRTNQEEKTTKTVPEQNNNEKPKAVTDADDHVDSKNKSANDVAEALNAVDDLGKKPEPPAAAEALNAEDGLGKEPETPAAAVNSDVTKNHAQKEQTPKTAEEEMITDDLLHEIGRNTRNDSMKSVAIEIMKLPDSMVHDIYKSKDDPNYEVLIRWRNRDAGTKSQLRDIFSQAVKKNINIAIEAQNLVM
eukprot:GHVU01162355.1.p1 GENE.GHVU01162355.1~~GHVU01162355.1.p1  ORF type:complete len:395 (-),score=58.42 GHVU01162355.1:83-1126(-)